MLERWTHSDEHLDILSCLLLVQVSCGYTWRLLNNNVILSFDV